MSAAAPADLDALSSLEDRIHRAVQLVMETRQRNQELSKQLEAVTAERDALTAERAALTKERDSLLVQKESGAAAATQAAKLGEELASAKAAIESLTADAGRWKTEADKLGAERNQVKTRIEKLLGQLDILASA